MGGHCWQDGGSKDNITPDMNATQRTGIMQRWKIIQHELIPELRTGVGSLTPKLEKVIHTLEWARIEEFISTTWRGCGRPEHDRGMLANAFVSKAILRISTTAGLIERLVGHISRDGTAIEAREKPANTVKTPAVTLPVVKHKRGRPRKDEIREVKPSKLCCQQGKPLAQLLKELPRDLRPWQQEQRTRLQEQLERLQATHRHGGLRHTGERTPFQRLDARQSGGDTAVPDDGAAGDELLRPDGCGLLQQRVTGTQPQLGACAADRS